MRKLLQIIIEKITGKTCDKCKHCINGISCDNFARYEECCTKIYPVGFEPKERITASKSEIQL